jgi:glutamyl-Q tRNA(Asp) synthetase
MSMSPYRGRFAPSPTGKLHSGSIVAAVASYADARHANGAWLLRIEDVDQTRARPDAERDILGDLETLGMRWDEPPWHQSDREPRYSAVLTQLAEQALAYRCNCSRKVVSAQGKPGREGPVYPGTCRRQPPPEARRAAWRAALDRQVIRFVDRIQGPLQQDVSSEIGDFIIRRIDGFTAYQLAVVVDDYDQGITHVVRGADLLWSTPRQIWLQHMLGFPIPLYAHVPLVTGDDGRKLSKRDAAHPVDLAHPVTILNAAWHHLGQVRAPEHIRDSAGFWRWAIPRWDIRRVPRAESNDDRPDTL